MSAESERPKVVGILTRKALEDDASQPDATQRVPPPPKDGLVLACSCGSTLHELLNAGVVRCSRCGSYGKVQWTFVRRPCQTDSRP